MTEYRLNPSSYYSGIYWLESRMVIFGVPLWWGYITSGTHDECWERMDFMRSPIKKTECIYEKDRR